MKVRYVNVALLYIILFVILMVSVSGGIWNSLHCQGLPVSCEAPEVFLEPGITGKSSVYTNSTSAKVSVAAPVWLSGWDRRVKITIDKNDVDSALSNFPVLVYLSNSSGCNNDDVSFIFDELQSDANRKKIAVTTSNGITQCYVEIERWDDTSEQAWLWVNVPSIGNTIDTDFYLYYDKDHADNTNYVGDQNSTAAENVWSSNYLAVHHMEEDPTGSIADSTNNNIDMTSEGNMTSSNIVDAKVGKGVDFDGINDTYISQSSITITQFTHSGWIKGDDYGARRTVATVGEQRDLCLENGVLTFLADGVGYSFGSALTTGVWNYVVVTYDGTTLRGYINGSYTGNSYTPSLGSYAGVLQFARWQTNLDYFDGILDEIRISNTTYSGAWVKACYESERDHLLDFGLEESNIENYVDNNMSDVDSSADKGTHLNFTAQQYGPDSIYDTLTEENTSVTLNDWGITSSAFTITSTHSTYRYIGGTSPNVDYMKVTKLHIRYSGTGTVAIALYTRGTLTDPTGATKRTEAYNIAVSAGWNEIDVPDYNWEKNTVTWIGWCHGGGSVYYSINSGDAEDFQLTTGRWDQSTPSNADETSPTPTNPGSGSFSNNWYAVYLEYEAPNYELDLEAQWTDVDYNETNEELAICVDKGNTYSLNATGGYMKIGDGTPNWGSVTGTISFWIRWNTVGNRSWGQHDNMENRFSGTDLVIDWGAAGTITSRTSFTAAKWYFIAIVWNENTDDLYLYVGDQENIPREDTHLSGWTSTVSTVGVTENNFMASKGGVNPTDGQGDDLRYWNIDRTLTQIQNDYNIELTGSETNLRSYFKLNNNFDDIGPNNNDGSGSGNYSFSLDTSFDEKIRVDFWNGSMWENLFLGLNNGWNNISVSSYLTSENFTIRFKGNTETADAIQDYLKVDVAILHVWTGETHDYVLKIVNQVAVNWTVNLRLYESSNIGRFSTLNISLHDGASSNQIAITNGSIAQSEGEPHDLPESLGSTLYISMVNLQVTTTGTSYLYVYLKIQVPNTSIYNLLIIVFEIT